MSSNPMDTFREILSDCTELDLADIHEDQRLKEDLEFDGLSCYLFADAIAEELDIIFSDDEYEQLPGMTVGDLTRLVERKLAAISG